MGTEDRDLHQGYIFSAPNMCSHYLDVEILAQASLLSICKDGESASAGPDPVSTNSACAVPFRWNSLISGSLDLQPLHLRPCP